MEHLAVFSSNPFPELNNSFDTLPPLTQEFQVPIETSKPLKLPGLASCILDWSETAIQSIHRLYPSAGMHGLSLAIIQSTTSATPAMTPLCRMSHLLFYGLPARGTGQVLGKAGSRRCRHWKISIGDPLGQHPCPSARVCRSRRRSLWRKTRN